MLFASFYYFLALAGWIFLLPFLIVLSFKKKYRDSIPARFFLKNNPPFEKELIHFHACSLGEVRAVNPLVKELKKDINLSVITNTGYEEGKKITKNLRYLPYEIFLPFWYKKQKVLVVLEAELWFMLFFVAKKRGAKTILLNARISDNSYENYKKFSFFYKQIFKNIDVVFAQTKKDEKRLKELGAKNIKVIGNIKVFQNIKKTKDYKRPKNDKPVLTLASTHEKEELKLLNKIDTRKYNIIIVPRHPERFEKLSKELEKNGFLHKKFSEVNNFENEITLVDKMGELINIYAISDIVLLGGSFVDGIGGHNPLEPAFFGCKIISGAYFFNMRALYEVVQNIVICDDLNNIEKCIKEAKNSFYEKKLDLKPFFDELK